MSRSTPGIIGKPPKDLDTSRTALMSEFVAPGSRPLDNDRYERFCQLIVSEGLSALEAYTAAGFSAHEGNASRLRSSEKVATRVEYLQTLRAHKMIDAQVEAMMVSTRQQILSKRWVLNRLMLHAQRAVAADPNSRAGSVANRALELLGKELGMFVDRSEVQLDVSKLTEAQIEELIKQIEGMRSTLSAAEVIDVESEPAGLPELGPGPEAEAPAESQTDQPVGGDAPFDPLGLGGEDW